MSGRCSAVIRTTPCVSYFQPDDTSADALQPGVEYGHEANTSATPRSHSLSRSNRREPAVSRVEATHSVVGQSESNGPGTLNRGGWGSETGGVSCGETMKRRSTEP